MALEKLKVRIDADTTGFDRGLRRVRSGITGLKKESANVTSGLTSITNGFKSMIKTGLAIAGITMGLKTLADSFKVFTDFESSVLRVNDLFDDAAKYVEYFAENTAEKFGMGASAAYQYASVYGNLFRGITASSEENAKVTIAMLKASAVVASKTGRTMEDVMERIRSGLLGNTEAIEDLGIQVNIAMLESTEAFRRIADGRSWLQLTFHEQQQIRTLAILEQAHKNFGDTVQQSSAYSLSVLSGAFKDLMATAGAFINHALAPIVSWLIQVVRWATAGLKTLAALFGVKLKGDLGSVSSDVSSNLATGAQSADDLKTGLGGATKAAKELKRTVAGFDELNILNEPKASGSSGGSGGSGGGGGAGGAGGGGSVFAGLPDLEYGEMQGPDLAWIDNLMAKFNAFKETNFFQGVSESMQLAIQNITPQLEKFKITFGSMWDEIKLLAQPFVEWFNGDFTVMLQTGILTSGNILAGLFDSVNMVFSDIWNIAIYPMMEKWTTSLLPMWSQVATEMIKTSGTLFDEVKKTFDKLWEEGVRPALELAMKIWSEFADLIVEKWNTYGKPIFDGVREAFRKTGDLLRTVWETILKPVWDAFMETVDWLWTNHLKPLLDNFLDFVGELTLGATKIYNEFIAPLVKWFVEMFGPLIANAIQGVIDKIGTIIGAVADVVSGVIRSLKGIIQFITGIFTGDWEKAWEGVKKIFKGVFDSLWGIVKFPLNLIIDGINLLIRGLNSISFDVPDWVPVIGGKSFGINIPLIPKLAAGGVVDSPTVAMIGEGGYKEAVVPLERNTSWIDTLAEKLAARMPVQAAAEGNITIPVYFGNDLFDTIIVKANERRVNKTNGRR